MSRFSGVRRGWTLAVAIGLVAGSASTVAAQDASPAATLVEVRSTALTYPDGALPGTVTMAGGCLPDDAALIATDTGCDDAGGASAASLGHVRLGFDALRTAQGGDRDTPLLRDDAGTRRTVTLDLRMREPGDVRVTMRGHQTDALSPKVVVGSPTPAATVDGATVSWTLPGLAAGAHELRAAFDLGAEADGVRFDPEIVVERVEQSTTVARHWRGDVTASRPGTTTHRLVLQQRNGGDTAPSLNAPAFETMINGDELTWSVEPGLTANGRHLPTDDQVAASQELMLTPEMVAEHGLTSRGMAFTAMRPPGAAKDRLTYGLRWPELGYHYTVASPQPAVDPWEQRPLATLYDGDATQSAIIADASPSDRAATDREPAGPAGRLVLTPNGPVTDAVATLAYTHVEDVDPNRTDPESLRSACGNAALTAAVSGEVFTLTAEGDVDNTTGSQPLAFDPVRIPHPPGYSRSTVLTLRGGDARAVEAYDLRVTFTDTETVITPQVPAGQAFLSTHVHSDGRRDWIAHPSLTIFYSRTRCPITPTTGKLQSVPDGATAELTLHAPGRAPVRRRLGSGSWVATGDGGRLTVRAAR